MADITGIAWTDHTFNPWTGCTRISPGCHNCYAAAFARRNPKTFGGWEPGADRKRTSAENWRKPRAWNRKAERTGIRHRVFCASMADTFDNQAPTEWRADLWNLVRETPWLDWQLLTKRPQNIAKMLPVDWGNGYPNVWLGATIENRAEADRRIPLLRAVPAAVRFLSAEPLLEQVRPDLDGIHWCIIGGESGHAARPMARLWADTLATQCEAAGVAVFFKQVGTEPGPGWPSTIHGKGSDPAQWPWLAQQFPRVEHE